MNTKNRKVIYFFLIIALIVWAFGPAIFFVEKAYAAVSETTAPAGMTTPAQTIKASSADTAVIRFKSDYTIGGWGFKVDKIQLISD